MQMLQSKQHTRLCNIHNLMNLEKHIIHDRKDALAEREQHLTAEIDERCKFLEKRGEPKEKIQQLKDRKEQIKIRNMGDLLASCGIPVNRLPLVAAGVLPFEQSYRQYLGDLFDPERLLRAQLERKLEELQTKHRYARKKHFSSFDEMEARAQEISKLEGDLTVISAQLATIPKRNTIQPTEIFKYLKDKDLIEKKLAFPMPDHQYLFMTDQAQNIWNISEEIKDFANPKLQRGEVFDRETIQGIYERVSGSMEAGSKLKSLLNTIRSLGRKGK